MSMYFKKQTHFIILIMVSVSVASGLLLWPKSSINTQSQLGGDFILQSVDGDVALSDYNGKVVVLYFGYAYCPDVCPTSLGLLSLALGKLKPNELVDIQALFISVDPERDTLENLKKYTAAFHPKIKGVTGSSLDIADVANRYGASYMKVELPDSALGYSVDHSSKYYLINRKGELTKLVNHGTSPEDILVALRELF